MLIREHISEIQTNRSGVVVAMSDAAIVAASVKLALTDIAKQASALGSGLQNAAPGDKTGTPNNSVSYLLAISDHLSKIAEECGKFTSSK